jgi:hypothetical protein
LGIFRAIALLAFCKLISFTFFKIKDDFKQLSLAEKNFIYSYLLKKDISSKEIGYKNISVYTFIFLFIFIFATY